jgi:hypothetical protein
MQMLKTVHFIALVPIQNHPVFRSLMCTWHAALVKFISFGCGKYHKSLTPSCRVFLEKLILYVLAQPPKASLLPFNVLAFGMWCSLVEVHQHFCLLGISAAYSSTPKTQTVRASEMQPNFCWTSRHHIPQIH